MVVTVCGCSAEPRGKPSATKCHQITLSASSTFTFVDATRARDAYNVISWYNVALLSTNEQNQSLSDFRIFQMHAIPTTHAGLNMRSRLEARKGAFQ